VIAQHDWFALTSTPSAEQGHITTLVTCIDYT